MKKQRQFLVYRIEHETKKGEAGFFEGPYRGSIPMGRWAKQDHNSTKRTPRPSRDGLSFFSPNMVFGFKSLDQIESWFVKTELKKLKKLGFVVAAYKVPFKKIKRGKNQLVFHPPKTRDHFLILP